MKPALARTAAATNPSDAPHTPPVVPHTAWKSLLSPNFTADAFLSLVMSRDPTRSVGPAQTGYSYPGLPVEGLGIGAVRVTHNGLRRGLKGAAVAAGSLSVISNYFER